MPRRLGRAAAKRAAAALESTPKKWTAPVEEEKEEVEEEAEADDEPMPDASQGQDDEDNEDEDEAEASNEQGGAVDDGDDDDDDDDGSGGEEEDIADGEENADEKNDEDDGNSAKSTTPPPEPIVRRRRLGRPPKNRLPEWDHAQAESTSRDAAAEATPRRRGRGGWRGRGGRRGGAGSAVQIPVDKDGNVLEVANDEVVLPEDPEGETKVDKDGNLQGGREYRCRTFTVLGRGNRLYMLSTEPARCVGFRDSYLFFTKHRKLFKIIVDEDAKRDMIDRQIIPHSYKGRSIGVVTARSVFREFGALIIVGGRKIVDDYEVAQACAMGAIEGELADPNDMYDATQPYNKNQYVAWHGASAVYHSANPQAPQQQMVKVNEAKKHVQVTDVNWMLEHALAASRANSSYAEMRRTVRAGIYDIHTNMKHYPRNTQPTHAHIEQVPVSHKPAAAGTSSHSDAPPPAPTIFTPLNPVIPRNFLVLDTYFETPPTGIAPAAYDAPFRSFHGHDDFTGTDDLLAPFQGLRAVSAEIRDTLPLECRRAFDDTVQAEEEWAASRRTENEAMCRRAPVIDKAVFPASVSG